jgi:hypothetical protein
MGTPEFSAPEQATDARSADIRADLYSLGCTLYCLLAGHPPFREDTPVKTIVAHLEKEPPPLPELRPEVPAALWAVVARLLAKDPAQRYQTPLDVAKALTPFCKPGRKAGPAAPTPAPASAGEDEPASPAPNPAPRLDGQGGRKRGARLRLLAAAGGGAAVVLLGIILLIKFTRPDGSSTEIRLESDEGPVARGQAGSARPAVGSPPTAGVQLPRPSPTPPGKPTESPPPHAPRPGRFALPADVEQPVYGAWEIKDNELVQPRWVWGARLLFGDRTWTDYDFMVLC